MCIVVFGGIFPNNRKKGEVMTKYKNFMDKLDFPLNTVVDVSKLAMVRELLRKAVKEYER